MEREGTDGERGKKERGGERGTPPPSFFPLPVFPFPSSPLEGRGCHYIAVPQFLKLRLVIFSCLQCNNSVEMWECVGNFIPNVLVEISQLADFEIWKNYYLLRCVTV